MPRRPGGLDPAEIDEAIAALKASSSLDDLKAALDRLPALSNRFLHAILRQQYFELSNAKSQYLAGFEARYRDLFLLLHERWHQRLVAETRARHAASSGGDPDSGNGEDAPAKMHAVEPYAPPFWLSVWRALDGVDPPARGPYYDPAVDADALGQELRSHVGRDVMLPAYELTPGSKWTALVVGCGACDRRRLEVRPYMVDLVVAPQLIEAVREQRINNTRCAACGATVCYPVQVWAMEAPGPGDALATLSCAWRLAPNVFSYQPPPGTHRIEENDRILEIRFDQLFRSVSWPEPEGPPRTGAIQLTMTVAYTPTELVHYLDRSKAPPDGDGIPLAMETMVRDMTRKVESGVLPLHQAVDAVLRDVELAGRDWPVVHPGVPREFEGPLLAHLFHSLIAEGVLRAQSATADARAMFASTTASSLLAMGEGALAEAALARADDFLAEAEPGRARELAEWAVADTRADLLEFLGRYDEAATIRQELQAMPELQRDDIQARFARLGLASQTALGLSKRGDVSTALDAFRRCIEEWQQLLEELQSGETEPEWRYIRAALHGLSGDYANLAALFTSLADDLVVAQIASMTDLPEEDRLARMVAMHPDPIGAAKRVDDAFDSLASFFGESINRSQLLGAADSLLRRALELSEQIEGWEFAGVQAHRLAVLHYQADNTDTATEFAETAIRHAARAGDHERIYSSHALLADAALKRGEGTAALDHLEAAARDRIRFEVGLGHHTELAQATEAFGSAAFQAVELGGDAMRAVMIVESLRAANTAASIVTGTPMQPADGEVPESIARLTEEREKLRLRLAWRSDDEEAKTRLTEVERELDAQRRQLSLRDPRYGRWVDATDVDVAPPEALHRRLAQLGPNSVWFGALAVGDMVWSYSADANGAIVDSAAMPQLTDFDDEQAGAEGASWTETALDSIVDALLTSHADRIAALEPDDALVISVAGVLHRVPFAALRVAGKRLCECAALVVVQGFGMFEAALDRPRPAIEAFVLVGGPKRPDLEPLPGAVAELDAIAGLLTAAGRAVDRSIGTRATVSALVDAAATHDAIHVACHAVADPSPDRASRLMLSPDIRRRDSGDLSEDRIITSIEVRPGALVNLAGCATGRTRESNAPLLGGLVPAFLLAGAGTVIASLWPIADAPAATFQAEFYRHLSAGVRPAAALVATQRRCARGELGAAVQDTAVWAAFAAYGAG